MELILRTARVGSVDRTEWEGGVGGRKGRNRDDGWSQKTFKGGRKEWKG